MVERVMARMGRRQVGLVFILVLSIYFRYLRNVLEWAQSFYCNNCNAKL